MVWDYRVAHFGDPIYEHLASISHCVKNGTEQITYNSVMAGKWIVDNWKRKCELNLM